MAQSSSNALGGEVVAEAAGHQRAARPLDVCQLNQVVKVIMQCPLAERLAAIEVEYKQVLLESQINPGQVHTAPRAEVALVAPVEPRLQEAHRRVRGHDPRCHGSPATPALPTSATVKQALGPLGRYRRQPGEIASLGARRA